MKFFVPDVPDDEAEDFYRTLVLRAVANGNGPINDRRYYAISYTQDGKPMEAVVGKRDPINRDEVVIAILEREGGLFLIYTERSGRTGIRGPYLTSLPRSKTLFD
jgi:hypothetical protein